MVKTYFKTVRRMFRHHLIRLFSLIGIILISVGFISGIGSPTDMIRDSMENYYRNQNVSDFIVKSKTAFRRSRLPLSGHAMAKST